LRFETFILNCQRRAIREVRPKRISPGFREWILLRSLIVVVSDGGLFGLLVVFIATR
jgi:hypothetical protein